MSESLFTSQTPAVPDANDGAAYTLGTYFTPAVDGTITHIRWYYPQFGQPGDAAVLAALFRTSDSAKLSGTDVALPSPGVTGTWNQVALTSPVSVTGGTQYCAAIRTPGRYVASTGGASPWPLTNGNLSAPTNAGRLFVSTNGTVQFPADSFSNGCYFIDVVFEAAASSAGTITPGGLAVPVALGPVSFSWAGSLAVGGKAVPVALGGPTLSQSQALAPGGLAVPVALGGPTLSQALPPSFDLAVSGLAVPMALGPISLSQPAQNTGSWETLRGIVREARSDHARNLAREANPLDCPEHGWPLELTPRGRHCKFGGHVV